MNRKIYFDNAATTQITDEALEIFIKYSKELYYNASAPYTEAAETERAVISAKNEMLKILGAPAKSELYYTSGGTESDNLAILGAASKSRKKHIISSHTEHPAVKAALKQLEGRGYSVTYLGVDNGGFVDGEELKNAVTQETFLVSIMHVNNETGALQDIRRLAGAVKSIDEKIVFHSDGVQAYGNVPLDLDDLGVDMYSLSAHKLHGPKGVGALWVKNTKIINPITFGGGQQDGMRPGTINTAGIISFAEAFKQAQYTGKKHEQMSQIKACLLDKIKSGINDVLCVNDGEVYSPHILSIAFKDVNAETLVHSCQREGLLISTGAACSSKKNIVSTTLKHMKVHDDYIGGAVRISFSKFSSIKEANDAYDIIKSSVEMLRKYTKK